MSGFKVLFLLDNIWSMGKGKGVVSLHLLLAKATNQYPCLVLTTDKYIDNHDYPQAKVVRFKKIEVDSRNSIFNSGISILNFLQINVRYFLYILRHGIRPRVIYCSSSLPVLATACLRKILSCRTIHRIYGTFLFPFLDSKMTMLKKFQEVLSFVLPADHYVITNDGTKGDAVAEFFGIKKSRYSFLFNGIDLPEGRQSSQSGFVEPEGDNKVIRVVCLSRLVKWKRVDRVIKAFNLISDDQIFLSVIGDGEDRAELESISKNRNVRFLGSLSHDEALRFLSNADIFVSMHDYSNVSNPVIEALSLGVPTITYNSGATGEVLDGHVFMIPKSSSEDAIVENLAKAIVQLARHPELRHYYSRKGQLFVKKNIACWESRIDTELKLIDALLE